MAKVSVSEYEKAVRALGVAWAAYSSEQNQVIRDIFRDSVIQRFEFSVELAWKVSVRTLGLDSTASKPAVREMARAGLIEDAEQWLEFIDARNKSSHTYDQAIAQEVIKVIPQFVLEAEKLVKALTAKA